MFYEYKCELCGQRFEARFPMGQQPPDLPCSFCKGPAYRVFTPLAFVFASRRHDQQMDNLDRDLYYANKEVPQAR
jgi:putative FmdB family regulatory protein